jgi:hypothetical protein
MAREKGDSGGVNFGRPLLPQKVRPPHFLPDAEDSDPDPDRRGFTDREKELLAQVADLIVPIVQNHTGIDEIVLSFHTEPAIGKSCSMNVWSVKSLGLGESQYGEDLWTTKTFLHGLLMGARMATRNRPQSVKFPELGRVDFKSIEDLVQLANSLAPDRRSRIDLGPSI